MMFTKYFVTCGNHTQKMYPGFCLRILPTKESAINYMKYQTKYDPILTEYLIEDGEVKIKRLIEV